MFEGWKNVLHLDLTRSGWDCEKKEAIETSMTPDEDAA